MFQCTPASGSLRDEDFSEVDVKVMPMDRSSFSPQKCDDELSPQPTPMIFTEEAPFLRVCNLYFPFLMTLVYFSSSPELIGAVAEIRSMWLLWKSLMNCMKIRVHAEICRRF